LLAVKALLNGLATSTRKIFAKATSASQGHSLPELTNVADLFKIVLGAAGRDNAINN